MECNFKTQDKLTPPILLTPFGAVTVAINELLCMKNAGAHIAMDFS